MAARRCLKCIKLSAPCIECVQQHYADLTNDTCSMLGSTLSAISCNSPGRRNPTDQAIANPPPSEVSSFCQPTCQPPAARIQLQPQQQDELIAKARNLQNRIKALKEQQSRRKPEDLTECLTNGFFTDCKKEFWQQIGCRDIDHFYTRTLDLLSSSSPGGSSMALLQLAVAMKESLTPSEIEQELDILHKELSAIIEQLLKALTGLQREVWLAVPNWNPFTLQCTSDRIRQLFEQLLLGSYDNNVAPVNSLVNLLTPLLRAPPEPYIKQMPISGCLSCQADVDKLTQSLLHANGPGGNIMAVFIHLFHPDNTDDQPFDTLILITDGSNAWLGGHQLGGLVALNIPLMISLIPGLLDLIARIFNVESFGGEIRYMSME